LYPTYTLRDPESFAKVVAFEYAKLQEALHAMCLLAEEAKADVIREQETARKAIEEAPQVIKENSEDTEKFNSLTSEVEALKASLQSERQAAEDLRNAFSEAEARNSELATNLENVTRRVDQLCESASLQSEQQAAEDLRKALSLAEARNLELTTKLENVTRRVDQLCESESQEVLVKCISQNLGYDGGKPVAACVIYKCLLHWRSFEVERTNIFDRIVKIIASAIEVS
jgi:myosin-5